MSNAKATPRRAPGTGSLIIRRDAAGRDSFYGQWTPSGGKQIKRSLGFKRTPGNSDGLTVRQAEAKLRELMASVTATAPVGERLTLADVATKYIAHLERLGRKRSTIAAAEMTLRTHLEPFLAGRALNALTHNDVYDLIAVLEAKGLASKSIQNYIGTLGAIFTFATHPRRRWASANPCRGVELPAVAEASEVRALDLDEVEALVSAARPGPFEPIDRALFRAAAMTGLRMGELIALRWRDVDWTAARIRVRQNYVLGKFGTPKSRRSTRSVPMADEVGGELERLYKQSQRQDDDDLVFANPTTGNPLDKSALRRRYRKALTAAKLDEAHTFHHLRHTFGTRMAAAGVSMRTLQEWMGHRDIATTQLYADYAPSRHEAELVAAAFARPAPLLVDQPETVTSHLQTGKPDA
jgi:integrase